MCPIQRYGADTTRLYEMFMGPLETTKPWSMQGVEGISRFLNRAWRMIVDESADSMQLSPKVASGEMHPDEDQLRVLHKTIQSVTQDMESLSFNTAISRLMEFVNYFTGQDSRPLALHGELCAPALADGAAHLGGAVAGSRPFGIPGVRALAGFRSQAYPGEHDRNSGPDQRQGARADPVPVGATEDEIKQAALADPRIKKAPRRPARLRKVIVVPRKLISIVTG